MKSINGAEEGTRTPTPLRVHGPEPCASANSATSAREANESDRNPLRRQHCDCTSRVVDAQRGDRLAGCGCVVLGVAQHALLAVLLQLVVQGLQADAEYFGGACLVVVRGLESFKDQQPFGFIDGGSNTEMDGICVVHGSARDGFSKSWRKMLGLDGGARADDDC